MDYATHNDRMVARFIWLETLDKAYADLALKRYMEHPSSPNPRIDLDVMEAKRKVSLLSKKLSTTGRENG